MSDITRAIALAVADRQSAVSELADILSRRPDSGAAVSMHQQLVNQLGEETANEIWLAACEVNCPSLTSDFPGVPGSMWLDTENDLWVHCADGRMRLAHTNLAPGEADASYGPMRRVGGA